jgi:hypothetical protein
VAPICPFVFLMLAMSQSYDSTGTEIIPMLFFIELAPWVYFPIIEIATISHLKETLISPTEKKAPVLLVAYVIGVDEFHH